MYMMCIEMIVSHYSIYKMKVIARKRNVYIAAKYIFNHTCFFFKKKRALIQRDALYPRTEITSVLAAKIQRVLLALFDA